MSDSNDLRPLWEDARANAADARLGRDLHTLFPARMDEVPDDLWTDLEPVVRRASDRARRRYFTRRFLASLGGPRLLVPLAAAATIAVVVGVAWTSLRPHSASPVAERERVPEVLSGSTSAPRLATLTSGAVIEVMGDLSVEENLPAGERVMLHSGSVRATVPHLAAGSTLTVTTAEADVVVRGTRFTVQEAEAGTVVSVEAGLVEVRPLDGRRPTRYVKPGERVVIAPFAEYVRALSAQVDRAADQEKCEGVQELVTEYLAVTSSAAEMSAAVYLQGVCADRQGRPAEAIRYFELAASEPSTRAENALANAARLHEAEGASEGAAAWRRYLARFPAGLHRERAQQFLADHPG